jgi:hypothetical protein
MSVPAIVAGDAQSVLQLDLAEMKTPSDWGQLDSDMIAHLLQVHGQIQRSRWNRSNIEFTRQGDKLLEFKFPEFEDFVFVAVYFRQLTTEKDDLLNDAANRFRKFVGCPIRDAWISEEQRRFAALLDSNALMVQTYTFRELFDAFMYGASLMHKPPHLLSKHRARFLEIYDGEPREKVLYSLNISMKLMLNHVGNIAVVMSRDFANWLQRYELPLPDVRWHDRMFKVKADAAPP